MSRASRKVKLPTEEQVKAEKKRNEYKSRYLKTLWSTISALLVVAAIAVLVSTLFFPVIQVSGTSMEPTLKDGNILVLVKSDSYKRGDICCIEWQNKKLIKRVIGLPGDTIFIDDEGNVYVNDELLDEPYVTGKSLGECDVEFPLQVPEGRVFVLGDHRTTSIDSRSSAIGCVEKEQIYGHKLFKAWPLF